MMNAREPSPLEMEKLVTLKVNENVNVSVDANVN